jgi:hypothetical protein
MTNDPDQIRADIERTRADLSDDVDALADQVNPKNVARRQVEKVTGAATSVKDAVMGTASDAGGSVGSAASSMGDAASGAPAMARSRTRGNPLAAGLVAFGAGLLVASLLPASEKEAQAAGAVKEKAEPLKQEATSVAKEAAEHLKEPAREAVDSVKETATEAAQTVKAEGTSAAQDVRADAQDAQRSVRESGG